MWEELRFEEKVLLLAERSWPVKYAYNKISQRERAEWFMRNLKTFDMEVHLIDNRKRRAKSKGPKILIINGERREKAN